MRERGIASLLSLLCVISSMLLTAQDVKQFFTIDEGGQETVCASNIIHERLMLEDAKYRQGFETIEQTMQVAKVAGSQAKSMTTFTIPIVVHVMHTGEAVGTGANISEAQVQSAIDALNEDYRKMPGTNGFGAGVDVEVEFCLASRDPNGNLTNGINRINASSLADYAAEGITAGQGSGANEVQLKAMSKWDRDQYYNIWIVTEIEDNNAGGGIQGYAYFPNSSTARDGAVIMYNAFGTVGNLKSYTNLNRTTTHELGHAFFLYHTFQGNSCSESNCETQGDQVCDTPPTIQSTSCNNPACGGTQQVENYMDYTGQTCMDMFTQGQKDRMRDAIQFVRPTLLTSLGCTPPNALDAGVVDIMSPMGYSCSASVTPEVKIKNFGSNTLTSVQVKYRVDGGALSTFQFNGNVASGATAIVMLPVISSGTGAHNFEVYTESPNGGTDGFQSNDSATQSFEVVDGSNVTVAIAVDNYGTETTWDITNSSGAIIATGGPYPDNMYLTTFESTVCLPEGCFEFNIYDSFGDGICCGQGFGGYTISDAAGTELITNGDDFTYTENRPFCTSVVEEAPEANFGFSQATICEGSSVQFNDQSTGSPDSWSWSFPGGSPSASTQQHPTVTYNTPGDKTVTLTVTNENGSDSQSMTNLIEVAEELDLSATTFTTSCYNSTDGSINLSINGGEAPYDYDWSNGASSQDLSNLAPGSYSVTVEGSAGCIETMAFSVASPSQIVLSVSSSTASCENPGTASVSAAGGSPGYTYQWNDPQQQTSSTATGLSAGTYTVNVIDSEACQATAIVTVNGGGDMTVVIAGQGDVSCGGSADGFAYVDATGGQEPYTYNWIEMPWITDNYASELSAGQYAVTVTDANGCQGTVGFIINEAAPMIVSANSVVNVSCHGIADGSISMAVQGGQQPFSYDWNGADFGATLNPSNIAPGNYTLTVTDANGCQGETTVTLTEPAALMVALMGSNPSCYGSSDGTLAADFSGGVAPYTYDWNGAGFGQTMNPQTATSGTYTVSVVDANGCVNSATMPLFDPTAISLSSISSTMASCSNDGTVTVSPTGGASGYTYLWSDPQMQTAATATGLPGGIYTVIVTDANGCQNSADVTVESTSDLNLETGSKNNATCAGYGDGSATTAATGGDGVYSYLWNDNQQQTSATATGLMAGVYAVTVTDGGGCQAIRSYTITEPEPVGSIISELSHDSCGLSVGKIVLIANGGTGDKTFLWDDVQSTTGSTLAGIPFGVYTAGIADENQCQGIQSVEIEDLDCVGTTEVEDLTSFTAGMTVYPNPVPGDQFTIALEQFSDEEVDIRIFNITGKLIMTDIMLPGISEHRVDLTGDEAEGIYFLQLTDGLQTVTKRIILIR